MKTVLILLFAVCVIFAGCSWLNTVAPSDLDAEGNPIPGTHKVIQPIADVTDTIPYADVVLGIGLLIWNGVERFKRKKSEAGLLATVKALKSVMDDPDTKTDVDKLKAELSKAHSIADVTPLIKNLLAKI